MEQPFVKINGKEHKVASVWWNDKGEITHVCYHVRDTVETTFADIIPYFKEV